MPSSSSIARLPLRWRLILGTGFMLLPLVVLGGGMLYALSHLVNGFDQVIVDSLQKMAPVSRLQISMQGVWEPLHSHLVHGNPLNREEFSSRCREIGSTLKELSADGSPSAGQRARYRQLNQDWQAFQKSCTLALAADATTESEPIRDKELALTLETDIDSMLQILESIYRDSQKEINLERTRFTRIENGSLGLLAASLLAGLAISLATALFLARSIIGPVEILKAGVRQLASGNLSHRVETETKDEVGNLISLVNDMAAKLEKNQQELKELSIRDPLTGLYNHREFFRILREEVERARRYAHPLSLLILDLDRFKRINDTYGHPVGDNALRTVAMRIREHLRHVDVAARYGGEEFALLLPETTIVEAYDAAERLRLAVASEPVTVFEGQAIFLTTSIGAATFPWYADSGDSLVAGADKALYQAKQSGRNRVCWPGSPSQPPSENLTAPVD